MLNASAPRFRFISHALRLAAGFRPSISRDASGSPVSAGETYLIKYPRESAERFASRNELTRMDSPLAHHTGRFVSFLTLRAPQRQTANALYDALIDDADGKGNSLDVFWHQFMFEAKARGSMLLLVDMPRVLPSSLQAQVQQRVAPYLTPIFPEDVIEYELGDDGRFSSVSFAGRCVDDAGQSHDCVWIFDAMTWRAVSVDRRRETIIGGQHALGICPVLAFTEAGDFPHFGSFAAIADLMFDLFNLYSELRDLLRSQMFSVLTVQVPPEASADAKIEAARVIGQTLGTSNMLMHSGATPQFVAPPNGPAEVYLKVIERQRALIDEIGLNVASPNQRESGISMQMRFHAVNSALAAFAQRMEDFERRVWDVARQWLGFSDAPQIAWPRTFDVIDTAAELESLAAMIATNMPDRVLAAQQRRIIEQQFGNYDKDTLDSLAAEIDARLHARRSPTQE